MVNGKESAMLEQALMDNFEAMEEAKQEETSDNTEDTNVDNSTETNEQEQEVLEQPKTEEPEEEPEEVVEETENEEQETEQEQEQDTEQEQEEEIELDENDLTYKVNGVVKEFPDVIKEKVKSKEEAQYFKDLLERSEGLDIVKSHRDRLLQEVKQYEESLNEINKIVDVANALKAKGDVLGALQQYGFKEEDILTAAAILVGTPEEKQKYQAYSESLRQQIAAEREAREKQQILENEYINVAKERLMLELQKPDVKEVAQMYDRIVGEKKFIETVVQYGIAQEKLGKIVSPEEAINYALSIAKPVVEKFLAAQRQSKIKAAIKQNSTTPKRRVVKKKIKLSGNNAPVGKPKFNNIFELEKALDNE